MQPAERTFSFGSVQGQSMQARGKFELEIYALKMPGMTEVQRVYVGMQMHDGAESSEVNHLFNEFAISFHSL